MVVLHVGNRDRVVVHNCTRQELSDISCLQHKCYSSAGTVVSITYYVADMFFVSSHQINQILLNHC